MSEGNVKGYMPEKIVLVVEEGWGYNADNQTHRDVIWVVAWRRRLAPALENEMFRTKVDRSGS